MASDLAAVARRGRSYEFEALARKTMAIVVTPMPARVGRRSRKRKQDDGENQLSHGTEKTRKAVKLFRRLPVELGVPPKFP
jgi:hypothetical protein